MRNAVLVGVLLGCATLARGQETSPGSDAEAEARYLKLVERASRLVAVGRGQEAEGVRRQADRQRQALLERLGRLQDEVDRLRKLTDTAPQILVQVRLMECSRTKLLALGFDMTQIEGSDPAGTPEGKQPAGAYRVRVVDDARPLVALLETMRKEKLLRVLAEPTLSAVSGQPAVYHVGGGEFPVPTPTRGGTSAVEFKQYGTRVDLTATVLGRRTIRLHVRASRSEIEPERTVQNAGVTIPGLRVRRVETGAEMQSGQTLVLSGVVQTRTQTVRHRPAVVGSLPGVGSLLGRTEESHEEVEMIVLVTPEIVPPAAATQAARPRPTSAGAGPMGLQYDLRR